MKYAHFVEMRVFSKEEDDENAIRNKITEIFPFEKLEIESKTTFGFEEKKIIILTVHIKKNNQINKFISCFLDKLGEEQRKTILSQMESRLDNNLHFFIRLDKDALLEDKYTLTDNGNCFHFRISITAYPHDREIAKKIIMDMIRI
jgi:RNA binding exosome subunit